MTDSVLTVLPTVLPVLVVMLVVVTAVGVWFTPDLPHMWMLRVAMLTGYALPLLWVVALFWVLGFALSVIASAVIAVVVFVVLLWGALRR